MARASGFKHTDETKVKMSQRKREWYKSHPNPMQGRHHLPETILKIRLKNIGVNNPNWKGGRTALSGYLRASPKIAKLKVAILKRDNYTCQLCGTKGGILELDHTRPFRELLSEFLQKYAVLDIKGFAFELYLIALKYKPFWDKKNLRILCQKCNRKRKHSDGMD